MQVNCHRLCRYWICGNGPTLPLHGLPSHCDWSVSPSDQSSLLIPSQNMSRILFHPSQTSTIACAYQSFKSPGQNHLLAASGSGRSCNPGAGRRPNLQQLRISPCGGQMHTCRSPVQVGTISLGCLRVTPWKLDKKCHAQGLHYSLSGFYYPPGNELSWCAK
jgi:hypothetical protein